MKRHSFWPTVTQEWLLKATLLPDRNALEAWNTWSAQVDIDHLDTGSYRLLPLLYSNLEPWEAEIEHQAWPRIVGYHRKTWVENQLLFHKMSKNLRLLHDAGIDTILLKGAALVLLHYKNYGARPMGDVDILVRPQQAQIAFDVLQAAGWASRESQKQSYLTKAYRVNLHALNLENTDDDDFDLHWRVFRQSTNEFDEAFWNDAVATKLQKVPTLALNPTDQLLHICVHGARWNYTPPIRWIADAITIFNTSEIDWDRFLLQVRNHRVSYPVFDTLQYLKATFDIPLAKDVLDQIQAVPKYYYENFEYKYGARRADLWELLPAIWVRYERHNSEKSFWGKLVGFQYHLRELWSLDSFGQLIIHLINRFRKTFIRLAYRLARKIRRSLFAQKR